MFHHLEHIGIAVKSIAKSDALFKLLLGSSHYKIEEVPSESVKTAFYDGGNVKLELIESTDPNGVIARFIEKKGEGIHHLAFEVENIEARMAELKESGIRLLNDVPKDGADNKRICFLHPKDTNGMLIELCEEKK